MRISNSARLIKISIDIFVPSRLFTQGQLSGPLNVTSRWPVHHTDAPDDPTRLTTESQITAIEKAIYCESSHHEYKRKMFHDKLRSYHRDELLIFGSPGPCSKLLGAKPPSDSRTDCQDLWRGFVWEN